MFTLWSVPLGNQCRSLYSSLSLSLSFSIANQRAGKVVDPAGRWFLWEGPHPFKRDSEMGRLGGQMLPWLFPPHGQVPFLPGESTRPVHWLQQSGERARRMGVLMWPAWLEYGWTVFLLKESLTILMYKRCFLTIETFILGFQSKDLQLDIFPASAPGAEIKLRDVNHELNEEKRKSARRKEYVF